MERRQQSDTHTVQAERFPVISGFLRKIEVSPLARSFEFVRKYTYYQLKIDK